MIRNATIDDIKQIVYLGERFYNESHDVDEIPYDPIDTYKSILEIYNGDHGILLVAEQDGQIVGITAGLVFSWYFNSSHKTGQELFWYVHPDYRKGTIGIRLLKELERQAKEKGATTFIMVSEELMGNHDYMEKLYHKLGYHNYESAYIRNL